jgi:hypothetical protein
VEVLEQAVVVVVELVAAVVAVVVGVRVQVLLLRRVLIENTYGY